MKITIEDQTTIADIGVSIKDFDVLPNIHVSILDEPDNLRVVADLWMRGWNGGGSLKEMSLPYFQRAGVDNPDDWEVVGSYYRDLSGWDEFEQKWEYHSEILLLLIHKDHYLDYLKWG